VASRVSGVGVAEDIPHRPFPPWALLTKT
jgi:hypothetical protein